MHKYINFVRILRYDQIEPRALLTNPSFNICSFLRGTCSTLLYIFPDLFLYIYTYICTCRKDKVVFSVLHFGTYHTILFYDTCFFPRGGRGEHMSWRAFCMLVYIKPRSFNCWSLFAGWDLAIPEMRNFETVSVLFCSLLMFSSDTAMNILKRCLIGSNITNYHEALSLDNRL